LARINRSGGRAKAVKALSATSNRSRPGFC
jgi:hypothetical protein